MSSGKHSSGGKKVMIGVGSEEMSLLWQSVPERRKNEFGVPGGI